MSNEQYKLHPIAITIGLFNVLKSWMLPLVIVVVADLFRDGINLGGIISSLVIIIIPAIFLLVFRLINWLTFRYWFEDEELRVQYGLFVKKKRFIPFERIQSFNYKESIFHRIFGLVQVNIETAGGSEPEVVLSAITKEAAEQIERVSRKAKQQNTEELMTEETEVQEEVATTIYKMSTKDLFILATTSNSIGVILSGLGAALSQVTDYIPYKRVFDELHIVMKYGFIVITFLVFIFFLIVWLISVAFTYINYYGFTVTELNNRLTITRGLIEKKRITVPINRVQAIKIVENPLRQWIGYGTVIVESVGGNFEEDMKVTLFPLIAKREMFHPLTKLFPQFNWNPKLVHPSIKGRPFFYRKDFLWVIPGIILCSYYFYPYGLSSIFIIIPLLLLRFWQYKTAGVAIDGNQLTICSRAINRTTFFAEKKRIQVIEKSQSYFQRRKNVASIGGTVMSGIGGSGGTAKHVDEEVADEVMLWFERKSH